MSNNRYITTGYFYADSIIEAGTSTFISGITSSLGKIEMGFSTTDSTIDKVSYNILSREGFEVYPILGMKSLDAMPSTDYDYAFGVYQGKPVFFDGSNWKYITTGTTI